MPETPAPAPRWAALLDFPSHPTGAGTARQRWAFRQPTELLIARSTGAVDAVLDAAHEHARQGRWVLGWVSYEAAPAFDAALPSLPPQAPHTPLAFFAVFDQAHPWPEPTASAWRTEPWQGPLSAAAFTAQIDRIHELIRAGEVYQINLTNRLCSRLEGSPRAYFQALHRSQPEGYAVYLDVQALQDGMAAPAGEPLSLPSHVLSVSPELFFHWDGQTITTRPMKGTAARGNTPQADAAAARHLREDAKERAENLMIVDLLRNDLSRVAALHSVQVPSLFDVQALPTVWQMTTTVQALSRPHLRLSELFGALFPCGSVTGAPKRRAMQHITTLENAPRHIYCGAVGLLAPGGAATFNVPIRTVELYALPQPAASEDARASGQETQAWRAECGIGSGITIDAQAPAEAREWRHKQGFLRRAAAPFELLESLRLEDGQPRRLDAHLDRLAGAASHFQAPFDRPALQQLLQDQGRAHPHGVFKLRLCLSLQGQARCEVAPLSATPTPVRVRLARQPMPPADEFIWHKTTQRSAYAPFAPEPGCFDTLLWNAAGELTESTVGNLALLLPDEQGQPRWYTPALGAGLLPGVMRATLLAEGRLTEAPLKVQDLQRALGIALINSVRGWLDARLDAS